MEYLRHLQTSLAYMENNLDTDISIADCARESGYSLFHFCRLFQMTAGVSVMDYIRKRRLSKAAVKKIRFAHDLKALTSFKSFV